eukprot:scaffold6501_cov323-Prasinococcus_capsulatus_cf.AAC.7
MARAAWLLLAAAGASIVSSPPRRWTTTSGERSRGACCALARADWGLEVLESLANLREDELGDDALLPPEVHTGARSGAGPDALLRDAAGDLLPRDTRASACMCASRR